MRATRYYIALSSFALALAGCSSSTGLADCSYPATHASFAPSGVGFTAVITSLRYSSGEHSPGGGPASQIDAYLTVVATPNHPSLAPGAVPVGTKVHIALNGETPVFALRGGSGVPESASACSLAMGQKVVAWIPGSGEFGGGFGDFVNESQSPGPPDLSSITFGAIQVEIL